MITEKDFKYILICEGHFSLVLDKDGGSCFSSNLKEDNDPLYNAAIEGLEQTILSLALAGVDVTAPQFQKGILDAIEGIANNI